MLQLRIGGTEAIDDSTQKFVEIGGTMIELEHSLVSLSKWESKFEKPFLGKGEKTPEEVLAYVECMVVSPNPPAGFIHALQDRHVEQINAYIEAKMTATWFREGPATRDKQVITAEVLYYWMTAFNIPFECQHWHLNRLLTLIRVCNEKQQKPKKMSKAEAAQQRAELNARRRAEMGSKG